MDNKQIASIMEQAKVIVEDVFPKVIVMQAAALPQVVQMLIDNESLVTYR